MVQGVRPPNASLLKRFASCVYEFLLLIALWMFCTWMFVMFVGDVDTAQRRLWLQIFLWAVTGLYFIVCWHRTGQTLAAQAWKIMLVNAENQPLSIQQALLRYMFAGISLMALGLGFLWALVDKDQLFLHDRLLKTRLISVVPQ